MTKSVTEGRIRLPSGEEVTVAYLETYPSGSKSTSFMYELFQRRRYGESSDGILPLLLQGYARELPKILYPYSTWAAERHPDAVVGVPSKTQNYAHFLASILEASPNAVDLSSHFRKALNCQAGRSDSTSAVLDAISVHGLDASKINTVVIVDDMLNTGSSIAAVLQRLRDAGLPSSANILTAIPLIRGTLLID